MRRGLARCLAVRLAILSAMALLFVYASLYYIPTVSASEVIHADILQGSRERGIGIYSPNTVTIKAGDTVTWTNRDINPHTVTSGKPLDRDAASIFASKRLVSNQVFSHTFASPGTFDYFCLVHPVMAGTVIVEEGPPTVLISSDRLAYSAGDTVIIRGTVSVIRNVPMEIEVVNPAGTSYLFDSIQVASNGSFAYSLIASGMQGSGTYKVIVNYLGSSAETAFRIEPSAPTSTGSSIAAGPTVTAASRGDLTILVGIKNTLPVDIHKVSLTASESGINSLKAPGGWHGEIDGEAAVFMTDDRPVEQDRRFAFLVTTSSETQSIGWAVFDSDGNPIADGIASVRGVR